MSNSALRVGGNGALTGDVIAAQGSQTTAIKVDVALTGNPTVPDQANGTNNSRIANTKFVQAAIALLINAAPGALDTLKELSDALGADANFAATMTTALAGKQPLDTDLTAIAALVSAANKLAYATGAGTWSLTDFTAFARTLVDDADAAASRTTLGLVIGTDVQAQDAELAAIAGLTSAADRLAYFTGLGTAALATFTAAGRALVDDADTAAQRTTLGLAALAILATVGTSQIDNDAVTYAKIQNVSATDKLLGRSTDGAGDVEEIPCTAAGRALLAAATQQVASWSPQAAYPFSGLQFPELTDSGGFPVLACDAATDEGAIFAGKLGPDSPSTTFTLVVTARMLTATSGAVRLSAQLEAITPLDTVDLDAGTSFDTANSNGATVPGTAGYEFVVSITMTNKDAIAPGDRYRLKLWRDADGTSGTDDATGDCAITWVELQAA